MTIVDAQGRLFGRWNFIDVVVAILVFGLVPVGYAAYVLFRTPTPQLLAVEPKELVQGDNLRVTIRGVNLRPYLRVSFDTVQGKTYLFQDSSSADIDLNPMLPGTYDVVLYDYGQERARLPKAFTIKPTTVLMPTSEVTVTGRFINVSKEVAAQIAPGKPLPIPGELVSAAPARPSNARVLVNNSPLEVPSAREFEVPAELRLPCIIKPAQGYPECAGQDFPLRVNYVMTLPGFGAAPLSFQIDQIRGREPVKTVQVKVRLSGTPEAVAMIKAGDIDSEIVRNPFSLGATVTSVAPSQGGAQTERTGVLSVRAQLMPSGWWYGPDTLRVSGQMVFRTDRYVVTATIASIETDGGKTP